MSCKLEPAIWSCDTGQQIPCFDRCQLIITWMSNIKEVYGALLQSPLPTLTFPHYLINVLADHCTLKKKVMNMFALRASADQND